jgi:hypothetical protein
VEKEGSTNAAAASAAEADEGTQTETEEEEASPKGSRSFGEVLRAGKDRQDDASTDDTKPELSEQDSELFKQVRQSYDA